MVGTADRLYLGDRIGNYRIEVERASGPVWSEYRAVHLVLPRRAVLKLMNAEADHPQAVSMLREACLLDALHHPGVLRVYESGLHERRPWFATELVEGPTMRGVMTPGALELADVILVLRDVAEVLEHAYRRGIIHCGLRPDRILMTGRTRGFPLCIVDWGDARAHDAKLQQYVPSQAAWHYTAPELVQGDPIDDRADVFAVGVMAYQMLAGCLPFEGGILATVDDGTAQHVPIEVHCPHVPPDLAKLVDSMLAYDRWDRPSASEVYAELAWLADAYCTPVAMRPLPAAASLRIRRPRWTPVLQFGPDGAPMHERARTQNDDQPPEIEVEE
ncbi:MAG: serine/threonine protein kinase [Deltaproteobacteria bacterium]|nr:serine/threonine protein kinase [Deltaproteobacteria bacterium]MCW5805397.1 serine/threonine protein kinase [Deltaproteobacteria bacterium]